jgi:hypothetical protein
MWAEIFFGLLFVFLLYRIRGVGEGSYSAVVGRVSDIHVVPILGFAQVTVRVFDVDGAKHWVLYD